MVKKPVLTMLLTAAVYVALLKVMSLVRISYLIGSKHLCFSASQAVAPLTGAFLGLGGISMVFGLRTIMQLAGTGLHINLTLYHIPTFFASFYWRSDERLFTIGVPILCMLLFVLHPQGSGAWMYSLYWLIPPLCALKKNKSILLTALGSTFTAHAVGSIIWLYCLGLPTAAWIGLIPMVAVERLLNTLVLVGAYTLVKSTKSVILKVWRTRTRPQSSLT